MDSISQTLKSIEQRLTVIETILTRTTLSELLTKAAYSCAEVAELTHTHGATKYRPYTVRLACSDNRIPEASKRENGSWSIPRAAVIRILEEGIPPERR